MTNDKQSMQILIKGARIVDPGNLDAIKDIFIRDGKIVEIRELGVQGSGIRDQGTGDRGQGSGSWDQGSGTEIIDAVGKIVTPGLIDMHVHLREPGHEYKETIRSGCMAAAHGGFTAVCTMPNTHPVNDNPEVTKYILKEAARTNSVLVYPVAAISKGLHGDILNDYKELKEAGAIALSDDGNPVMDSRLMRGALESAGMVGMPLISHSEDISLSEGGAMNEGAVAAKMGFPGIPNAAESIMVMRDIALCELIRAPLHIAHVSTAESVWAIRDAKQRGVPVTAETAPHYFTLTDAAVENYGTNAKMNPPLRSRHDKEAILEGLADGTIDVIATDHAPHSAIEKEVQFDMAANGIIGLETSLPLSLKLIENGVLTLACLIEKMSKNPARILGLENSLTVGNSADITIIDPELSHTVDAGSFRSLSRNTPFNGWRFKGRAVLTMVGGRIVYQDDK